MMLRILFPVARVLRPFTFPHVIRSNILTYNNTARFSTLQRSIQFNNYSIPNANLLNNKQILDISRNILPTPIRTVTKFSHKKGKRKTSRPVIRKFFRLHWGGWIRTMCGRQKKLWKKSSSQKRRLKQHVLVNATQATLLDKMVTKFWKRPKYYVDDPYEPYHSREEFMFTRKRPIIRD